MRLPSDGDSTGREFGSEELALLEAVIRSGTLNCTRGTQVAALEREFGERFGFGQVRGVTSGTAALHAAVAAVDFEPGDEVITSPITDMGAITPILYQGGIPVFADTDPVTLNMTAESVAARMTERTRAVIVTHLFGQMAPVEAIVAMARKRGICVIEDCAQAYRASAGGKEAGQFGDIACFSMQQGKHMSAGEGGLTATHNAKLGRRMVLFSDKAWGYGDAEPDHYFLALNYRMTELQGAVGRAQLGRVDSVVARRQAAAALLTERLAGVDGLTLPVPSAGNTHVYWKYPLTLDRGLSAEAMAKELGGRGVFCAPRYIKKPAFACAVIRDRRTLGTSGWPWSLRPEIGREKDEEFPGTYEGLERVVVLPWNERYELAHIEFLAEAVKASLRSIRS